MSEALTRYYTFSLPVFKQGNDLAYHLADATADVALLKLACQYDEAARLCRKLAEVCADTPGVMVDGDTHHIGVTGPAAVLDLLVEEGVLLSFDPETEDGG